MKHNDWFESVFLASLKNGQCISEKQVAICRRYMVESRCSADTLRLASGNMLFSVYIKKKGYGQFEAIQCPHNVEECVTDRFGNQFSAFL